MRVDRDPAVLDAQVRHQRIRGVFQPTIAADDAGGYVVEVMHQGAAEREQRQRNRQPEYQPPADRGGHGDFASSKRYPRPRRLRMTAASPSLARSLDTCTSMAFGVRSWSGAASSCCTRSLDTTCPMRRTRHSSSNHSRAANSTHAPPMLNLLRDT